MLLIAMPSFLNTANSWRMQLQKNLLTKLTV